MKRLLLLLPLLLTPTAQAIDYVRCEAMLKTISRLQSDERAIRERSSYLKEIGDTTFSDCMSDALRADFMANNPWETGDFDNSFDRKKAEEVCRKAPKKTFDPQAFQGEQKALQAKIAAVRADYKAEGCY